MEIVARANRGLKFQNFRSNEGCDENETFVAGMGIGGKLLLRPPDDARRENSTEVRRGKISGARPTKIYGLTKTFLISRSCLTSACFPDKRRNFPY